ncbi:hypothetical protein LCGC14_1111180 [marine sediment metagenome]|uniref:Uncharacterized protein n=1 Tax=marine sediment metagenome TaxID=412755 RepID=A0A0F9PPS5_9ZZZZ
MNYTKACGCKIYVDDSDTAIMELEYCPMHKAAPDMQEALKAIFECKDDPQLYTALSGQQWIEIENALDEAEGK